MMADGYETGSTFPRRPDRSAPGREVVICQQRENSQEGKDNQRNKRISLPGEYDCSFNFWTASALSKGGSAMHNHICAQSEKTFLEVWKSTATWENFCEPRSGIGRREGSHDEAGPGNKTEPECEHAGRKQPEDEEGVRAQP